MSRKIRTIEEVAAWQLCCGCGACAYICPSEIDMIDTLEYGRRPRVRNGAIADGTAEAIQVCSGIELTRMPQPEGQLGGEHFYSIWGPVLGVWEGHAADPEVRYEGSSGGAATALSLFALETQGMHGVLHTRSRKDAPLLNETVPWMVAGSKTGSSAATAVLQTRTTAVPDARRRIVSIRCTAMTPPPRALAPRPP